MRRACSCLAAGAVFLVAAAGAAQLAPSEVITVVYSAPPGCPSQEDFLASVRARTQRFSLSPTAGGDHRVFRITIGDAPSLIGTLEMQDPERGESSRELRGNTCAELADAMAFVVATAVDPSTAPVGPASPAPEAAVAPTEEPDRTSVLPTAPVLAAPAIQAPGYVARAAVLPSSREWQLLLGGGGQATVGLFPSVEFSVLFATQLLRRNEGRVSSTWGLTFATTSDELNSGATGSAKLAWTRGSLDTCPLPAYADLRVAVLPCARFELGRLSAEGANVPDQTSDVALWLAAGVLLRLDWIPWKSLHFQADAGLSFPLGNYYVYRGTEQRLYTFPPVGGVFALSAFWALP